MSLEHYLIEHCSPTLARLKSANLFRIPVSSRQELEQQLLAWNQLLGKKGVQVLLLKEETGQALIYVCRSALLKQDLTKPGVGEFLQQYGYPTAGLGDTLTRLRQKLQVEDGFPHEIGIFLGYPLDDVQGFIQNHGKNCKCTGCWKVYGDPDRAEKLFAKYQKCREVYCRLWRQGRSVWQLTVAA